MANQNLEETSESYKIESSKNLLVAGMDMFSIGYIYGKDLEDNIKDILIGPDKSKLIKNMIPDNFDCENHSFISIWKPLGIAMMDYIDRWQMYAELFKDEKYAC